MAEDRGPVIEKSGGVDPESGSKYLSSRDITNFLSGRDVLVARDVDRFCELIRTSPQAKGGLRLLFAQEAEKNRNLDTDVSSPHGLATLKTLKKPEFKEVKNFFEKIGATVNQSLRGIEEWAALDGAPPLINQSTMEFNPEMAQVLICTPGFMDPIVAIRSMPPIPTGTLRRFENAVQKEENHLYRMAEKDQKLGTDQYSKEIEKVFQTPPLSFIQK